MKKKNEKISAPHCKPEPSCCKHGTCHKSGEYCCCTVSSKFLKIFLPKKKIKNVKLSMKIGTTLRFVNMDTNEALADDTVIVYEDLSSGEKEAGLTNSEGELIIKVIK